MANDVLRIKNDVLNELRNQKYYVQDELAFVVDDTARTQKEKVSEVIRISSEIVTLNSQIALVEGIFVDNAPQQAPAPIIEDQDGGAPDNIVEAPVEEAPVGDLNAQGQTHSE